MGRGRDDGARLIREWFGRLAEARGARRSVRVRVRDGEHGGDPPCLRPAGGLPRDQLPADRGAPRGARVPGRRRGLRLLAGHLRLREGRRRDAAPGGEAPDGAHPEAGARGAHECVQHLSQVGGDLGADVQDADLHDRRAGFAARAGSRGAERGERRAGPPLRGAPDPRAHRRLREAHRAALRAWRS